MTKASTNGASEHYTIISADCHAGGSHATYREYLDPKFHDDFDAWRGKYKNPFKDLGDQRRYRNWDNEMRNSQQEADGVVGEVIFPNTVPPFFPSFVLFAPPPQPDDYEHRRAGIQAHNRWLVDWCGEFPERRAGMGQIFLNDVDDAIEDVRWIKEHGLRGGVLLPNIPPDVKWLKPLYDPEYDRLWAVCQDLDIPVHIHGGTGAPDYGKYPVAMLLYINEVSFYSQRPFVQLLLSGVFERFPRLKFVMTEQGCAWIPPLLARLDKTLAQIRKTGATGEIRYGPDAILPKSATEYFHQNCWVGVSQPGPDDASARYEIGIDRFMWGSDYPHDEGTHPFTREHLRQLFWDVDPAEMRQILGANAAKLYDFDLKALQPLADKFGPTVEEISRPLDRLPDNPNEALLKAAPVGASAGA
ncbi:MAG TPA: amidohydrolase family protein [Acidimicrobiales bacterium]|nr:amidohydrolase family protein [Acidimicrobiales bacterium]